MTEPGLHAPPALARAAHVPLGLMLILSGLTAIAPFSIDMYLPGLPALGRSLGASPAAAQQTVAAYFFGIAFGQVLYGPLSDRVGRRGPILAGLALYAVAALGCALAPSIAILCGCRALQAIGGVAGLVIARAIVRDRFAAQEVLHVFATLTLVASASPIVAPTIGAWLLEVTGWRELFMVQAAAGLALAIAVSFGLAESRSAATAAKARSQSPARTYLELLGNRQIRGYVLFGACSGAVLYTWIAGSPDILIRIFGLSPQQFSYVFAGNMVGLVAATQINARLARRYPSDAILRIGVLIALAASLALVVAAFTGLGGIRGILGCVFIVFGSLGFTQTNAQVGALNVAPHRSGSVSALLGSIGSLAGASAAAIASAFRDGSARPTAVVIAVSLVLAAATLGLMIRRDR